MTYREGIRLLDGQATAVPWGSDGELYGRRDHGAFHPLGFAPHRPLDSRLIAVYRSGVMQLIDALDAIERMSTRASGDPAAPAAISISQVLQILDAGEGGGTSFRAGLAELDRQTTPPPWDAGHLVLGMELDAEIRSSLGIATPRPGDGQLIAVVRSAVPRALEALAFTEECLVVHGNRDGSLRHRGALNIADAVAAFDRHRIDEGMGTGTV